MAKRLSRWILRLVASLLAGMVVSLIIAEATAMYAPLGGTVIAARRTDENKDWVDASSRYAGGVSVTAPADAKARFERLQAATLPMWNGRYGTSDLPLSQSVFVQRGLGLEYETFMMGYDVTDSKTAVVYGVRAGWPMRCVNAYRFNMIQGWGAAAGVQPRWVGAVEAPRWLHARQGAWTLPRPIPAAPLWGGLAVNAVVCGAAVAALAWAWRSVRVRSLRRKGLCLNCGYALAGACGPVCPECGVAR